MRRTNSKGFTLIEILMVLILISVLAAVAINAFVNFRKEAKDAALRSNLAALRAGITAQYAQMQLRCGEDSDAYPPIANLTANDITSGGAPCTTTEVDLANERKFVQGEIPESSFSDPPTNEILECGNPAGDCTRGNGTGCSAATFSDKWCYNPASGEIWSDSDPGDAATDGREAW